jgi:hypothetical protein
MPRITITVPVGLYQQAVDFAKTSGLGSVTSVSSDFWALGLGLAIEQAAQRQRNLEQLSRGQSKQKLQQRSDPADMQPDRRRSQQ